MPADTFSPFLGLRLQATGNNQNAWGDILNASTVLMLERAIAGNAGHAVVGGTLDLSGSPPPAALSQALDYIHIFSGVLVSAQVVIVPNISKSWLFVNGTSGAFPLTVKTPTGTPVHIPVQTTKSIFCNGANRVIRLDQDDIGIFIHSAGGVVPNGSLLCDGASLLKTEFPDLFTRIGTTFGSVDSLHFSLPNLTDTGRFLRSVNTGSLTLGTYQSNLTASHAHTITGAPGLGTLATDSQGNHTHTATVTEGAHNHTGNAFVITVNNGTATPQGNIVATVGGVGAGNLGNPAVTGLTVANASTGAHIHNVTGAPSIGSLATATSGGTETRPEALAVVICIKY